MNNLTKVTIALAIPASLTVAFFAGAIAQREYTLHRMSEAIRTMPAMPPVMAPPALPLPNQTPALTEAPIPPTTPKAVEPKAVEPKAVERVALPPVLSPPVLTAPRSTEAPTPPPAMQRALDDVQSLNGVHRWATVQPIDGDSYINLRTTPKGDVIKQLTKGSSVKVTDKTIAPDGNEWYAVTIDGQGTNGYAIATGIKLN